MAADRDPGGRAGGLGPAGAAAGPRVVVIGAGIVGLCVAWHLARAGAAVTVLDGEAPGSGASSGNAGAISGGAVAPLAMPGVLKQVPGMLLDPAGALHIPPRYALRAAPWLMRFVASARPARVARIAEALSGLLGNAMEQHRQILAAEGALDLIRETGQLYLYRDRAHYAKDAGGWDLRRQHGMRVEFLEGRDAIRALEPDMRGDYDLGLFIPDQGSSVNPLRQAQVVARGVERLGGSIRRAAVRALATEGGRVAGAATAEGMIPAEHVVLAAGAWSARLLAPLGLHVPLETQRGYHVMLPEAGIALQRPVVPADRKAFISPMEGGLRVAGTVEFGGLEAPPTPRRAELLLQDLRNAFPQARTEGAEGFWMGHRPCLPDSLPVIGPVKAWPGLWCAFGHGHLGLTGSAPTGALLAQAMLGPVPNLDLTPFGVERFA
ncbi:NAD(P)/FAD-dependent oxidoreductase [Paracraurococcus ruber]|uniref:FAD-dependent oxidoreductase n=1 Tax=Paracraurococcus ruber TaxID=77675 RepID=A0ABS1D0J1_9PROT|nr:FAD-dependent oxidoreductase [Paracraurococcus ruber]MBK1660076.1 FAD-dependent oxidoreductase [Paracraurococcus ruber]TDG34057.1 FAD-dependent oxidoreductase [Paracraurococcus ruber]